MKKITLLIGLASSMIAISLFHFGIFKTWEYKTYDLRMALTQKTRPKPENVVLFYVDEPSLRHMEKEGINWPWPRELYPSALNFCKKGGAKAVIFDLFFSEDSVYGVGDDDAFASGIKNGPPSYFVLFLSKNINEDDKRIEDVVKKAQIPISQPLPIWMKKGESLASLPIEGLIKNINGFGNATLPSDYDGIYRRAPLIESLNNKAIPSIALKVASDTKNTKEIAWPNVSELKLDETKIPLDDEGEMLINYYGKADTFPNYPMANVLISDAQISSGQTPILDPSIVKDKIVIIGVAAPGLYDLKPTPLSHTYPGPEVHATIIENLLRNDFITPLGETASMAITLACGIVISILLMKSKKAWTLGLWIILTSTTVIASSIVLFSYRISTPLAQPISAILIASFSMVIKSYMMEGRKKREIKKAFGQYLSPHIVSKIASDPEALKLGGETKEVSLFFSDIADFTTISEKTAPEKLVGELNGYFSTTTHIIQGTGGTLDKYIGDAIMAFWGAPLSSEDHASSAVFAALDIQSALQKDSPFKTRIGIHTGLAVVGNIGSDIRFNYTAIGDTVNLASRLEGLNKKFWTKIIISETTYKAAAKQIEARLIGRVRVKGRTEPVGIYEPIGRKGDFGRLGEKHLNEFQKAIDLYMDGKFQDAMTIFQNISKRTADTISIYYTKECEDQIKNPPKDFDGVITFTTK